MPYKDKQKQKEAVRLAVYRYRHKQSKPKGITEDGEWKDVIPKAEPPNVIPVIPVKVIPKSIHHTGEPLTKERQTSQKGFND